MRIIKYGNPILRMKAKPVDIQSDGIHSLTEQMFVTMREDGGIGLAAPQVAVSQSFFVIDMSLINDGGEPTAIINPQIVDTKGESTVEEGCLSIPDIREDVIRPETIRVRYQDINGNNYDREIDGLEARVFQHEIDHLNGVLFIDRIGPMKRKLLQKKLKQIAEEESQYL
ncbi:peptide deformylase [candidate division KSB1 bacterium]|nr:peptide deformylase [candidate division KSB1 bacterium]